MEIKDIQTEQYKMVYGSVCSGIEAATVAWEPIGWTPAWYSEIDPFCCALLKHHYPQVPNLGDMTTLYENEICSKTKLDLLVGGTPCQSFSTAGLRHGLDDEGGDLALQFVRLVSVCQPEYFVWENVAGVLSNHSGRAFRQFTNNILECGYSCSWRVLDSQYFGVAQSRRRVYLVGHHDWRCAASVLFESEVPQWSNNKKSQTQRQRQSDSKIVAPCFADVYNLAITGNIAPTYGANSGQGTNTAGPKIIDREGRIRRVTPIEAERLMGFPDDYTLIPGKCLESQRYKALGNSMVIPVMSWLGRRIHQMHRAQHQRAA
ncbi:MAG: DNA (cytosine-5-)-methyltransferase [Candidatus Micrarchaeaceae archaeon]